MQAPEEITLYNLLGGALDARFLEALEEVARSIDDPNTDPTAKRQLLVKLTFKPSEQRTSAQLAVEVTTKLPGRLPLATTTFFAYDHVSKRYLSREYNPKQMTIADADQRTAAANEQKKGN